MKIEKEEVTSILNKFNPWWQGNPVPETPQWKRAAYGELRDWVLKPPAARAVLLSGARQVGKTTLFLQIIEELIAGGVPPANILYATFDHPIIKLAGIDVVIAAWREREPKQEGKEYVFLDEAQFVRDWGTWVKHQVDFNKNRRVFFTGSASPLLEKDQESGVGRWHTIRLTTLSFLEYIQLKGLNLPTLPSIQSLRELLEWSPDQILRVKDLAEPYIAHFHEYLLRGGFPQTAQVSNILQAQKLLREDIVDRVLKRDMTAIFNVRRVVELELLFLYLCRHDGGILNLQSITQNLDGIKRPTVEHFINLLEATHLIYRLIPFGYGKEVLRGRYKVYLADAAIAPAVMLKGKSPLDNPEELGVAAEAAVLKHLFMRYYTQSVQFSYWRQKKGQKEYEVDLIAEIAGQLIPFEVKYRSAPTTLKELEGISLFCKEKQTKRGYVITKSIRDFGLIEEKEPSETKLMRIPATLLCYWMGEMELRQQRPID